MKGTVVKIEMFPETRWIKLIVINIEEMNKADTAYRKGIESITKEGKVPECPPNFTEFNAVISPVELEKTELKLGDEVEVEVKKRSEIK